MKANGTTEAYARALFDLAVLSDSVDSVDESLTTIVRTVRGSVELRDVLADTTISGEKKREILRDLFAGGIAPEAVAIASILVEGGHVDSLGDMASKYAEIAEKERGIVVAEVVTAVEMQEGTRKGIVDKLSASLGRPVTLRERVDASILGGVVISVAGRVLDGSLVSQLNVVRSAMSSVPQGGEA